MTGGRVVILGHTGRNFAAGMSGGIAYIWDPANEFLTRCNLGTVELEKVVTAGDKAELHALVQAHHKYTQSAVAGRLLADWPSSLTQFVKVMPVDYKRVLAERKQHDAEQEAVVHVGR
jgi:glutamate synthase (NADPH/NADH) large chain